MEYEGLHSARVLMGDSLGFHIVFVLFGIGLPLVISLIEYWSIRKKDNKLREWAKRLSYIAAVLVVTGVVSGTLIAVQLSLFWSGLVEFGNPVIGLPFLFEGYAFLLEAVFLGLYIATWDKIKGYKHWLLGLPVIIGSFLSAFFITSVSAWMNKPGGFSLDENGNMIDINIIEGLFTKTFAFMAAHSIASYYLAVILIVLAGFGWYLMRKKRSPDEQKRIRFIMVRLAILAVVISGFIGTVGHFNLQYLATSQPAKFAAIEVVPQTTTNAPYVVAPELSEDEQSVSGLVEIPNGLSLLTGNSPNTEVPGLNEFPRQDWPNLIISKLFEVKMALVLLVIAVPVLYILVAKFKHKKLQSKLWAYGLVLVAFLSVVIIELGWMVTELGRQPFAVVGYLRTSEAYTTNPGVYQWGIIFPILFVGLLIASIAGVTVTIKRYMRTNKKDQK